MLQDGKPKSNRAFESERLIVHDYDLQLVVNELTASGAEAIAINGQRVISRTAIRCVGPTIMVNNVPIVPPFEILAVGDPGTLAGGLLLGGRFPFYSVYDTADSGHVALAAIEPILWYEFCRAVDRLDLAPQQFADGEARGALFAELEVIFAQRTSDQWAELIRQRDLAAEVVARAATVPHDRHLAERQVWRYVAAGNGRQALVVGPAVRCRGTTACPAAPAPDLAADTFVVLRDVLGLDDATLQQLQANKVVFGPDDVRQRRLLPASLG